MQRQSVALFGEAERGQYRKLYLFHRLEEMVNTVGHPPRETLGLHFAIQALLYEHDVLYFRVHEEGFSVGDYLLGLELLATHEDATDLAAICLPGVGDSEIIETSTPICQRRRSLLVLTEADLFDYLTSARV